MMTVGELKQKLEAWPDYTVVYVDSDAEGGNEHTPRGISDFEPAWVDEPSCKIE